MFNGIQFYFLLLGRFLLKWTVCTGSARQIYGSILLQGGALNRGLKRFFSIYRPSCHIEAYIGPEKYCFVWAGPLANHHSILTSFFLATAKRRRRRERHVLLI